MTSFSVRIEGIADVNAALREVAPREAKNLMRATVVAIAKDFAEAVIANAPEVSGDLKASTKARRKRGARDTVEAAVAIEGGGRAHWHFPEFGTGPDGREQAYVLRSFQERKGDIEQTYVRIFADKLVRMMARKARAAGG